MYSNEKFYNEDIEVGNFLPESKLKQEKMLLLIMTL